MDSQQSTASNGPESQPLSPQVQLEKWCQQIGGSRATAGKWQAGASSFLAGRFADRFIQVCLKEAKASRTRAAVYGSAWALLDNDEAVIQAGLDALFYLIDSARDETRLSRVASALGKRTELVLFLMHPAWGKSWHLEGLRLANGKNLGVAPLMQRLRAKNFKIAEQFRPLPAVERQALGRLFIEITRLATGMIEVEHRTIRGRKVPTLLMTETYWKFLSRWKNNLFCFRPAKMPMIEPPREWTSQYSGGFHTYSTAAIDIPPERWNHHTRWIKDCVLGSLNVLQNTPITWNHEIMELQRQLWELNHGVGSLPPRDRVPYPIKAEYLVENHKEASLQDYWDDHWKWKQDKRRNGQRSDFIHGRITYERLKDVPRMFFTWKKDRRGRKYMEGGNTGYLKADTWRSQLQSDQGALISGNEQEFAWAVGDAAGLPKSWDDRLTWFAENELHIIAAGQDPLDRLGFWERVKEPFRFISLCQEWAKYEADYTYKTKLFFQLDQTCSAYGHAACLTRDQWLAEQTNVVGSHYSDLYLEMLAAVLSMMQNPEAHGLSSSRKKHLDREADQKCLDWWLEHGVTRKLVKEACMPIIYGRSHQTLMRGIQEYLRDHLSGFIDRESENLRAVELSVCLAKYIHRAVKGLLPSVGCLAGWLRAVAKVQMECGHRPYWLTPNGLLVESYSSEANVKKHQLVLSGRTVKFQCDDREGAPLDKRKSMSKLAADYVHSMDAAFLEQFVWHWGNTYNKPIITVHDCMATTLDNVSMMRTELQDQFSRFYSVSHLEVMHYNLERELNKSLPAPPVLGDLKVQKIGTNPFLFS